MKTLLMSLTALALVAAAPAFAADKESYKTETKVEAKDDGSFEKKTSEESTNMAGTTDKTKTEAKVDVKSDGTADKKVMTKTTHDPKGLFNAHTTKTEKKVDADGVTKVKKTVDGKTVVDQKTDTQAETPAHTE